MPGTTGNPFDPPDISCGVTGYSDAIVLSLCGGGWGGAPAGFAVEMQTLADYEANGWSASSPSYLAVSITGASYGLNAGQCINLQFGKNTFAGDGESASNNDGAPLACNTTYVFRTKAYATSNMAESDWSGTLRCSTEYDCNVPAPGVGGGSGGNPFDPPDISCGAPGYSDALVLHHGPVRLYAQGGALLSVHCLTSSIESRGGCFVAGMPRRRK